MPMYAKDREQSETSTPKVRKSRRGKPNGPLTKKLERNGSEGIVTLTVSGQAFGRRVLAFMPQRSRAAIGQVLHHEIGEACFGRSDGVACRRCCRWRHGWRGNVALIPGT